MRARIENRLRLKPVSITVEKKVNGEVVSQKASRFDFYVIACYAHAIYFGCVGAMAVIIGFAFNNVIDVLVCDPAISPLKVNLFFAADIFLIGFCLFRGLVYCKRADNLANRSILNG